jgi:hypothetical protein
VGLSRRVTSPVMPLQRISLISSCVENRVNAGDRGGSTKIREEFVLASKAGEDAGLDPGNRRCDMTRTARSQAAC